MPNFFITDKNGTKHSFNEQQLQALAAQGRITPNTPLESDTGHKGAAGQIPGLQFNAATPPVHQTPPKSLAVEKGAGSSWQVTLIGAVLIMVVGGIGWAIIGGTSPAPPQKLTAEEQVVPTAEEQVEENLDAESQFQRGIRYATGEGVAVDYAEAVEWFRKAAEQGHAEAQGCLGVAYFNGNGVAEDKNEAVKWYQMAAEQGDATAQYNLGYCYFNGVGVAEDKNEAVKWYQRAAEQGDAAAQYNLGYCYYNGVGVQHKGRGVLVNLDVAVVWLSKAASQGHTNATMLLAQVRRDHQQAEAEVRRLEALSRDVKRQQQEAIQQAERVQSLLRDVQQQRMLPPQGTVPRR